MPRRGLPESIGMRHDEHYVEALAASAGTPIGRMIPIDQIDPNPNQPRQVMGDLSELIASINEKGIIEPLVVRARGARFQEAPTSYPWAYEMRVEDPDGHVLRFGSGPRLDE